MNADPHNLSSRRGKQGPAVSVAGIPLGPSFAVGLYVLLIGAAALALFIWRFPGRIRGPLAALSPWLFLTFVVAFAVYRLALVRARRYPAFKAFLQIGVGVLFFTLLLQQRDKVRYERAAESVETLLEDPRPGVRALAAEVIGYRPGAARLAPALVRALEDPSPEVREQAHRALVRLAGVDLGPANDPKSVQAWREKYP